MVNKNPSRWYIPKRYIVAILGFFGLFNVYAMRVNLSIAMVAMVNSSIDNFSNKTHSIIVNYDTQLEKNFFKGEKYFWNSKTQGVILGSFFYGYIITQIPSGILSERYGAKWLFGFGILITAVFTLLTPLAASLGTAALVAIRILEGLGEGITCPAINMVISRWFPSIERSTILAFILTGSNFGTVISMSVSGWLSSTNFLGGWPSVFYIFGAIGCIWFVLWAIFITEYPSQHPYISTVELSYIQQHNVVKSLKNQKVPWKSIATSLPMWAVIVSNFGFAFGFVIILTELPTYLDGILHFNIKANGLLTAFPYILQAIVAWLVSYVADWLRKSERMSINSIRKIANTIALCGPAACLIGVTVVGRNPAGIVALFALAMALMGFVYSGSQVTTVDMSPDLAGTLFGITNSFSSAAGIIGPLVVGHLISSGSTVSNWNNVFYIAATFYIVGAVFYAVFASSEVQPWGVTDPSNDVENFEPEKNNLAKTGSS